MNCLSSYPAHSQTISRNCWIGLTWRQTTVDDSTLFVHALQLATDVVYIIFAEANDAVTWPDILKFLCKHKMTVCGM